MNERTKHIAIDENLHRRVKSVAAAEGFNMREYTEAALLASLAGQTGQDAPGAPSPLSNSTH